MLRIPFGLSADSRGDTGAAGGVIMKLAIRVTDPGNDAKWNFLFGEDGFARHFVSASERATNKAMTIKPMALLELNQKDLREMWRCLSGE